MVLISKKVAKIVGPSPCLSKTAHRINEMVWFSSIGPFPDSIYIVLRTQLKSDTSVNFCLLNLQKLLMQLSDLASQWPYRANLNKQALVAPHLHPKCVASSLLVSLVFLGSFCVYSDLQHTQKTQQQLQHQHLE